MNAAFMKPPFVCRSHHSLVPDSQWCSPELPSEKILSKWNSENWNVCLTICDPAATAMDFRRDMPGNDRWLSYFSLRVRPPLLLAAPPEIQTAVQAISLPKLRRNMCDRTHNLST